MLKLQKAWLIWEFRSEILHQPVLLEPTITFLFTDPEGTYVDCTLGGGGHLQGLLDKLSSRARVIAIDQDREILEQTRKKLNDNRVTYICANFRRLQEILFSQGIDCVNGVLLDLGVSSFQLDIAERGFSFHQDAALDMRMDRDEVLTAGEVVNHYSEAQIADILFQFGEERYARRIAAAIVQTRRETEITSTMQLVEIIKKAVPAAYRREKHPARKTFQALRIAVNGEMDSLQEVLPQAVSVLGTGGRLCVISFHSLEDREVKQFLQQEARECICPPHMPICTCGHTPRLRLLNRKPVKADATECMQNPRARSAKLRAAERI